MSSERSVIAKRPPEQRVAYVEGFAAGWKAAAAETSPSCEDPEEYDATMAEMLNQKLDFLSSVENLLREQESGGRINA